MDRFEMLRQRFETLAKKESESLRASRVYQQCAVELARVLAGETPTAPGEAWETKEKPE